MSWVFVSQCTVSDHYWIVLVATLHHFQGVVVGALLNMPLGDRLGLGNVRFRFLFYKTQVNVISLDARGRASLPDCSVSYPISSPSLSDFCLILRSRWNWKSISGWYYSVSEELQPLISL